MGVKMIWPHDRTGLSLISPDLSQNKAARRKRATERKETLTLKFFFFLLLRTNQNLGAEMLKLGLGSNERSVGGRTPVVALGVKVIVTRL